MTTNADHVELEGLLRLRYAEINELKAENERLHGIVEFSETATRQQREGFQAEIEQLTAALRSCAERFEAHGLDMPQIARAALEKKS